MSIEKRDRVQVENWTQKMSSVPFLRNLQLYNHCYRSCLPSLLPGNKVLNWTQLDFLVSGIVRWPSLFEMSVYWRSNFYVSNRTFGNFRLVSFGAWRWVRWFAFVVLVLIIVFERVCRSKLVSCVGVFHLNKVLIDLYVNCERSYSSIGIWNNQWSGVWNVLIYHGLIYFGF